MPSDTSLDVSFLDQLQFRDLYFSGGKTPKIRLYADNINCSKCIQKIESIRDSNLQNISASLNNHTIEISLTSESAQVLPILQKIKNLGFHIYPLENQSTAEKLSVKTFRKDLIRLAVVGTCAGQIMTLALSEYFGLPADLKPFFNWVSFALYLPVVTYGAWPFYEKFLIDAFSKKVSIDTTMTLASLLGFAFSTYNLIQGQGSIYFDSLSGFVFLILLSRFFQRQVQRKINLGIEKQTGFIVGFYKKHIGDQLVTVPVKSLMVGDQVQAMVGDPLQFDAQLISESAWVDPSSLTGESAPKLYQQGQIIPAGSVVLKSQVRVSVQKLFKDSEIGQTIEATLKSAAVKSSWLNVTDIAAQVLMVTVLTIGVVFLFVTNAFQNPEMLERFLALIILACPCALAFGTPLAFQFSMRNALKKGIVVKSINAFFEIHKIKNYLFDKTGTLTDSQAQVQSMIPVDVSETDRQVMASIQAQSYHPMAFAIRSFLDFKGELLPVSEFKILQNLGVGAIVGGDEYQFLDDSNNNQKIIGFYRIEPGLRDQPTPVNKKMICQFLIKEPVYKLSQSVIAELKKSGRHCKMLTGDQSTVAASVGQQLGFTPSEIYADLTAFQKALLVQKNSPSVFIGDGENDSLSMTKATVSIAVGGAVGSALKSCDVLFVDGKVEKIFDLLKLSQKARRLMIQNITLSFTYNFVGGVLALMGFVSPMVAAALMPLSSGLILLSTVIGGRE